MIEIDQIVKVTIGGTIHKIGLGMVVMSDVVNEDIALSLDQQFRAIRETVDKLIFGEECNHHPSEKIIGIISLEPICNQCIRERTE